jgi:hypothetical protein
MKRREWLRGAITAPALAAATAAMTEAPAVAQTPPPNNQDTPKLTFTTPDAVGDGARTFLSATELQTLEALARVLMPPFNGRPGAVEAGAPQFLDFLLSQSPAYRQELYRRGLSLLESRSFSKLGAAEAKQVLASLEQPWTFDAPADPLAKFLRAAKDDLLQATVNSKEWAASSKSRTSGGTSYYYFPIE